MLIPACNEAAQITATVRSLQSQTLSPQKIITIANNCIDDTAQVARKAGSDALELHDNPDKKAGALNYGLGQVMPRLSDDDLILLMDADSVLCKTWLEDAAARLDAAPELGAVSGTYLARRGKGLVTLFQRAEYAQEGRRVSRRQGKVDVLSGTATLVRVRTLRHLLITRGFIYDQSSLTEDFEFTLALKGLGYHPRSFKELRTTTDVMETWSDLYRQRVRWQRGTIETLRQYGFTGLTRKLWLTQVYVYGSTLIVLMTWFAWGWVIANGGDFDVRWLAIMPIFALEQAVTSRKAGLWPSVLATLLFPMSFYGTYRLAVYWIALIRSIRRAKSAWA